MIYVLISTYFLMRVSIIASNSRSLITPSSGNESTPLVALTYPTLVGAYDDDDPIDLLTTKIIIIVMVATIDATAIGTTTNGGGDCNIPSITTFSHYGGHHATNQTITPTSSPNMTASNGSSFDVK